MTTLRMPEQTAVPSDFMRPTPEEYDLGSTTWPVRVDLGLGVHLVSVTCLEKDITIQCGGVTYSGTSRLSSLCEDGSAYVDVEDGVGTVEIETQAMGHS